MTWRMMGASSGNVKRRWEVTGRGRALPLGRLCSSMTSRRGARVPRPSWFQCMMMQPQEVSAATSTISGFVKPETSFTMAAPRRTHMRATSAWRVSMDTTAPASTRARTTGTTRSASTFGETGVCPGRVDSPPTSMMSAPWSSISRPRAMATLWSRFSPPSEKESGVTLRTPMMRGRASETSCSPQCQVV